MVKEIDFKCIKDAIHNSENLNRYIKYLKENNCNYGEKIKHNATLIRQNLDISPLGEIEVLAKEREKLISSKEVLLSAIARFKSIFGDTEDFNSM